MAERIIKAFTPLQNWFGNVINGSVLLFLATIAAMVVANSSASEWYYHLLNFPIHLQFGSFNLFTHQGETLTFLQFVNDALMAVFFFTIGLEIKREVLVGELSSLRKALLPVLAAIGGMIVPVAVYMLFSNDPISAKGGAIPMATDIAFALGVLSLLGKRVPLGLKVFLTALAVVDDIGGILVIAIFYSGHIALQPLFFSFLMLGGIFLCGRLKVQQKWVYYILGFVVWLLFMEVGVHPTIAGVLVAFAVPAKPFFNTEKFVMDMYKALEEFPVRYYASCKHASVLTNKQIFTLKNMEHMANKTISPLQSIVDDLEPLVNYVVLPTFAFVNAGITFKGMEVNLFSGVSLAVFCGLFVGKTLGIFSFTYFFVRTRLVQYPRGMNTKNLFAVSILGGIGFTVALFIANLAFTGQDPSYLTDAKIGVFLGSLVSGVLGYFLLSRTLPPKENS